MIISNCVINLATDKLKVLQDAYELLKPGGEMYFSDVYSDCRIPQHLQEDKVLWGECLSGALYNRKRSCRRIGGRHQILLSNLPFVENRGIRIGL